jgi:hypothetical protein
MSQDNQSESHGQTKKETPKKFGFIADKPNIEPTITSRDDA